MKWLLAFILAIGLGLFLWVDKLPLVSSPANKEGRVLSAQGIVMGLAANDQDFKDLTAGSAITNSYKIITGVNSSSLIEYGEVFKILEQSSIQVLQIGAKYQVHLLEGTITRQQFTDKTDYFVDGVKVDALQIKGQAPAQPVAIKEAKVIRLKNQDSSNSTSQLQEILDNTFKLHQRFIERCFIKHYDKLGGQTEGGLIILDFEVAKSGRLRAVRLKQSPYSDESFHQCLIEVFSRVKLKGMDFKKIIKIEFPLQITLPQQN